MHKKGMSVHAAFAKELGRGDLRVAVFRAGKRDCAGWTHRADAKPLVERGLELEPTFRAGVVYAAGMAPIIADRLVEGARLLELSE